MIGKSERVYRSGFLSFLLLVKDLQSLHFNCVTLFSEVKLFLCGGEREGENERGRGGG